MTNILFVIPSFKHGGTNKSLTNIIPFLKKDYNISVLALSQVGPYKGFFDEEVTVIKGHKYVNFIYDDFGEIDINTDNFFQIINKTFKKILRRLFKLLIGTKGINKILDRNIDNIKSMDFDIILAMQEGDATNFVSRIDNDMKKIAWVRSDYAEYYKIIQTNESQIYDKFNEIICVSEYTKNTFLNIYPEFNTKTYGIHNVINAQKILEMSETVKVFPNSKSDRTFKIVSIGRLSKVKRFDMIPKIAKELLNAGENIQWYIIGNGEEKDKIMSEINNEQVKDFVIMLGEIDNPYPYIKEADLVVVTSLSEACPNVLNESKILHTPIITTDFGSAPEFINNRINGIITSKENLTNEIINIINDELFYNFIISNIKKFNYSNENNISKIFSLFEQN